MKKIFYTTIVSLGLFFAVAIPCTLSPVPFLLAVEIYPNAGTTSATFLKLGAGSRAVSMGSSFAGLADDASAIYWNPAGLAQLSGQEIQVYHNESFEGIRNDFIAYTAPYKKGVFAAAVTGLYTPKDIERRSGLNESDPYEPLSPAEGLFQAYDVAAHAGYARWLRPNLAAGIGVKLIDQTIDDISAFGIAADAGILYRATRMPLSTGFVIQNFGTPIKFIDKSYPLPLNFKLGSAWRWNKDLVTTMDFNKSIDNFLFVSAGAEYIPLEFLSLRAGYRYRWYGQETGDFTGVSIGVGFNFRLHNTDIKLDYAFVPYGELGNSHRLTVRLLFGKKNSIVPPEAAHPTAAAKKEYGVLTPSPSLPDKSLQSTAGDDASAYVFYPVKLTSRRRAASGQTVIYHINGMANNGGLVNFQGMIKMNGARKLQMEWGEKRWHGDIHGSYTFKRNFSENIQNATITMKLPVTNRTYVAVTTEGTTSQLIRIGGDGVNNFYEFYLERLAPFSLIKK